VEDGVDTRKTWREILIDSAIIGAIAAFAVIGGAPPTWDTAWVVFKAFGAAFVIQLAVERGLKRAPVAG
jgi:hypothetical protein